MRIFNYVIYYFFKCIVGSKEFSEPFMLFITVWIEKYQWVKISWLTQYRISKWKANTKQGVLFLYRVSSDILDVYQVRCPVAWIVISTIWKVQMGSKLSLGQRSSQSPYHPIIKCKHRYLTPRKTFPMDVLIKSALTSTSGGLASGSFFVGSTKPKTAEFQKILNCQNFHLVWPTTPKKHWEKFGKFPV